MEEIWRAVPRWEDKYEVSNLGNVRISPSIKSKRRSSGQSISKSYSKGYLVCGFCRDGVFVQRIVHHLVLEAFIGIKPFPDAQANHKNGKKDDNRLENLEWCTPRENVLHTFTHLGRKKQDPPHYLGEKHPRARLNWNAVNEIRALNKAGVTKASLARQYGVGESTIRHAIDGDTWKKLDGCRHE